MTTISATTVLRSRNAAMPGKVLSTLLLRYPLWIHAEFMTHRMLSRNAASSRAIPVSRLLQDILNDPAVPLIWGKNQKGMQATETFSDAECQVLRDDWDMALRDAIDHARLFVDRGVHKQIVNRLLAPFAHITVLASGTEWANFLALRDHPDAEPHMRMLAQAVRKCLDDDSTIQTLRPGEWHLPFITDDDWKTINLESLRPDIQTNAIKLSVARCASTSYKTVDGFDMTLDRALALHDKLVGSTPMHASPLEHVAQADGPLMQGPYLGVWEYAVEHGNFVGFRQYRKQLANEWVPA